MRHLLVMAALLAALVSGVAAPGAARAAEPEMLTYTVQPGDSIWSIAEAFYGSGKKYQIVYKYNTFIGKPPFLLKPGQVLRLPKGDVLPEAQVTWTKRDVKAKPPKAIDWLDAREKMNLWKLYKVATGGDSAVNIVFEDESDLRLRENALLVIYGGSARRTAKQEKTKVVLEQGTLRGGLARLDGDPAPLQVETPSGNVELFAKLAQIEATVAASMVSVYDGRAAVKGKVGAAVDVAQGYGTVVKKGKAPEPPRPLPPAPAWETATDADGVVVALVPQGAKVDFKASWKPVDGAASYRVEIADDKAFKETFLDVTVSAAVQQAFLMKGMEEGTYFARVAARDELGLEGSPTAPMELRVVGIESSRAMSQDEDGVFTTVALTRLVVPPPAAEAFEWRIGSAPFAPGSEPLRLKKPGRVVVDVRRVGVEAATPFAVTVLAAQATLGELAAPLNRGEDARDMTVTVTDERGRPAVVPDMVIEASPGGILTATERSAGEYVVKIAAPVTEREVGVRVSWPGGELGRRIYPVANAGPDTVPYVYDWRDAAPGLLWDRRLQATALPAIVPVGYLGFHARVGDGDTEGAPKVLGLTLVGEVALLEDKLGLDAALTFFRPSLEGERAETHGVGDLVLGVRYLAVSGGVFTLAPSLRLRVPLAKRAETRVMGIEPGVLLRLMLADGFWVDTRQAVVVASDFGDVGTHLAYSGTLALGVRPVDVLSVGAELDASVALSTPDGVDSWTALAAGLGVYLHLGRARLGLTAGLGLNDDGKARFGDFSGALSFDLGYGGP